MELIENPIPTQRAWLTWQRPLSDSGPRPRMPVGELRQHGDNVSFRYLPKEELVPAVEAGFYGYPALQMDSPEHANRIGVDVLIRRLPPKSRPDFPELLEKFGLPGENRYSDLTLLAYTGARMMSDSFSVAETFDGFDAPFRYVFDVAGYRHHHDPQSIPELGTPVRFERDPQGKHDPQDIRILYEDGRTVGHIHQLQAERVGKWVDNHQITGKVFLVNRRIEYPRLFVMAQVSKRAE